MSSIDTWARSVVDQASANYDLCYGGGKDCASAFVVIRWQHEKKVEVIPTSYSQSGRSRANALITYSFHEGVVIWHGGHMQSVPMEQVINSALLPGAQIYTTSDKEKAIAWLVSMVGS